VHIGPVDEEVIVDVVVVTVVVVFVEEIDEDVAPPWALPPAPGRNWLKS